MNKYRTYSLGAWYYCHASSIKHATYLLRRQCCLKVGRWKFDFIEKFNENKWTRRVKCQQNLD